MIPPEKPPSSIAHRTRVIARSQRTLKLGPLLNGFVRTKAADPWVAASDSVGQPEPPRRKRSATSRGTLVHPLAILNTGHLAAGTPPIRPGSSATLTLALGPGTYVMASTLFFDQAAGTYGTLRVTR